MTKTLVSIAILTSAALFGAACKKTDGATPRSNGGASNGTAAAPAKSNAAKLPKLGLQIDVTGDYDVGDGVLGDGNLIQGAGFGALQVEPFEDPQTLDQAKSDAAMYSPKHLKAETLADGWALTYDNTGSLGANYFVTVRRDIAGKPYKCSTTGSSQAQADAALAACKTLRP